MMFGVKANGGSNPSTTAPTKTRRMLSSAGFLFAELRGSPVNVYASASKIYAMRIKILDHPLVAHKISVLRDKNTPSPIFRQLVDELVTLLAYEATREIRVEERRGGDSGGYHDRCAHRQPEAAGGADSARWSGHAGGHDPHGADRRGRVSWVWLATRRPWTS